MTFARLLFELLMHFLIIKKINKVIKVQSWVMEKIVLRRFYGLLKN